MEIQTIEQLYFSLAMKLKECEAYVEKMETQLHNPRCKHMFLFYTYSIIPSLQKLKKNFTCFTTWYKGHLFKRYQSSCNNGLTEYLIELLGYDVAMIIVSYYKPTMKDVEIDLHKKDKWNSWVNTFVTNGKLDEKILEYD
tara:strand:- start:466 stop:885 length:420 start_codon:yes stop_codon:yes gene_type:complete